MIIFRQKEYSDKENYHTLSGAFRFSDDRYDIMHIKKPGRFLRPWEKSSEQIKYHNDKIDKKIASYKGKKKKNFGNKYVYVNNPNTGEEYWKKV